MSTLTQSIITALLCLLALACGGEVHLTNGQTIAEIPHQNLGPKVIQEKHIYGEASGTHVVAFVVYPSPALIPKLQKAIEFSISAFTRSLMNHNDSVSDFYFIGHREVDNGSIEHFSASSLSSDRTQWSFQTDGTLKSTTAKMKTCRSAEERTVLSPFVTFEKISKYTKELFLKNTTPIWLHLVYFRDQDTSAKTQDANIYLEKYIDGTIQPFQQQLRADPLSPFRTRIHLISYNPSGSANRFRFPSNILQKFVNSLPHHYYELDTIMQRDDFSFGQDKDLVDDLMAKLGDEIIQSSKVTALQKPPKQDTLKLKVNGTHIPRSGYQMDEKTNRLNFFNPTKAKYNIKTGDIIEIEYETENEIKK
jgi:hypothetical protein